MKNSQVEKALHFVLLGLLFSVSGSSAFAVDPEKPGLHSDSDAGVVISSGNANSQSFNFGDKTRYLWDNNALRFTGRYLHTNSDGVDTAQYWSLGTRYERILNDFFSIFVGEMVESNVFSGFVQRYNNDMGGKYFIFQEDEFDWSTELGYRYTLENRFTGQSQQNYIRVYTEANHNWTKSFSVKADVEYLPDLSISGDYQLNTEVAGNAALSEIFALKVAYLIKYRALPPPPATNNTDTQFTTALVAKF